MNPNDKYKPLFKPIMTRSPTEKELAVSQTLDMYMEEHYPRETPENLNIRELILADLDQKFRRWVKETCSAKGLPKEVAEEAGGKIYTSGSYRLGVHEPGADIDTICVAPKHVNRDDFFTTLKEILVKTEGVTNLVPIEGAAVPIITFDYNDVNIDLLFAVVPTNSIPASFDIDDDSVLQGVDNATEKSLNGPRVTNMIVKLVPRDNFDSFLKVLRVVRIWAKRRGLYSNKMGYLGGVNYCILVAFVAQLYPNASPSTLLQKFFLVLAKWEWPSPIQLCAPYDAGLGSEVWNANLGYNRFHVMPIITPAYPSMNSSVSVSKQSLLVIVEELKRACKVVTDIIDSGGNDWNPLFEPSDFFIDYLHYLCIDVSAATAAEEHTWGLFVESRLRKLVEGLASLPLKAIRLFPKKYSTRSQTTEFGFCYYVGFEIDKNRMHGNTLNIEGSITYFRDIIYAWPERTDGMEVKISHLAWKALPEEVFESLGGKEPAKVRKKELRAKLEEEMKKRTAEAALVGASKLAAAATQTLKAVSSLAAGAALSDPLSSQVQGVGENGSVSVVSSIIEIDTTVELKSGLPEGLQETEGLKRPRPKPKAAPELELLAPTYASPTTATNRPATKRLKISFTKGKK